MRTESLSITSAVVALVLVACGESGPSANELNDTLVNSGPSGTPSGSDVPVPGNTLGPSNTPVPGNTTPNMVAPEGVGPDSGGSGPGVVDPTPVGPDVEPDVNGEGGRAPVGPDPVGPVNVGGTGSDPTPNPEPDGSGGAPPINPGIGGMGPDGTAGMGTGGTPPVIIGPYDPREGAFNMLVYSRTAAFRHDGAIATGKALLQEIANEWGFTVTITETNEHITFEGLSQFEIVFFMNPTGDIFNNTEQAAFERWMTEANGAFAGTHSATDTENGWAFYAEVTGQYYDGHGPAGTADQIQFEQSALNHPALAGLPNPWQRNEEWYRFNSFQSWSSQPGFQILGRKSADNQPIMWVREWANYRAFYTALGHDAVVFDGDDNIKRHLTGGILWAVRREHWLQ